MHLGHLLRQKSYEKVVVVLRSDRVIFVGYLLFFVVLTLLPAIGMYVLAYFLPEVMVHPIGYPVLVLLATLYYLSIWLFFFTEFIDYYLDVWIITNDRVVNIEQQGLFARTISELDLFKIQDVTSEVKGVIPTMFNFGNVYIQTAGQKERFIFKNIPAPHEVRKTIVDLIAEDRKYHATPLP